MLYLNDIINVLQGIPWFLELKPAQLEKLAQIARLAQYGAGCELFHEGEKADMVMILLTGEVAIENLVPTRGPLCTFMAEPLDIIGWSTMTPVVRQRTSTARTTQQTTLITFEGDALKQLCEQNHDIGYVVMKRLANVVASRLLTTRLHLFDLVANPAGER